MTSPVPGWYPDPQGSSDQGSSDQGAGERWWDGTRWTGNTRPTAPAAAPPAWDGWGNPVAPGSTPPAYGSTPPAYGSTPPAYGSTPPAYGSTPPPFAGGPAGGGGPRLGSPAPRTFLQRNGYSFGALGVTVAYLLILAFAHFILVGILPLVLGISAVRRREPLGWPAVVVGALAFVVGLYFFTR